MASENTGLIVGLLAISASSLLLAYYAKKKKIVLIEKGERW